MVGRITRTEENINNVEQKVTRLGGKVDSMDNKLSMILNFFNKR